jgi:hypothetical protein
LLEVKRTAFVSSGGSEYAQDRFKLTICCERKKLSGANTFYTYLSFDFFVRLRELFDKRPIDYLLKLLG